MLRFEPIPPAIPEIYRHLACCPDSAAAALVRLVDAQKTSHSNQIIGHLIAFSDGELTGPAAPLLHWLVEQPMELANAVRLFWVLFRPDVYLGKQAAINNVALGGPDRLFLLRRLSGRIEAGKYPRGVLGLSARQSKLLKIALVQQTQEARFHGWDQMTDAGFVIPDVCLMPLTGNLLSPVLPASLVLPVVRGSAAQVEGARWAESYLKRAVADDLDLPEAVDELALLKRNNRRAGLAMSLVLGLASLGATHLAGKSDLGAPPMPVQIATVQIATVR